MRAPDDRMIWETFLKQAEANRAISNAILSQTQRMVSKDSIAAMEPDRLESWYDAADVASIAGMIVEQASSLCQEEQHVGDCHTASCASKVLTHEGIVGAASNADGTARYTSEECTKCALGTKRVVPSVLELLKASCKTRVLVPRGATGNALDEQGAVECNDNDKVTAEVRVTTAIAAGVVEAVSACDANECNDTDKAAAEVRATMAIAAGVCEGVSALR